MSNIDPSKLGHLPVHKPHKPPVPFSEEYYYSKEYGKQRQKTKLNNFEQYLVDKFKFTPKQAKQFMEKFTMLSCQMLQKEFDKYSQDIKKMFKDQY